jgi:hypothetical protein
LFEDWACINLAAISLSRQAADVCIGALDRRELGQSCVVTQCCFGAYDNDEQEKRLRKVFGKGRKGIAGETEKVTNSEDKMRARRARSGMMGWRGSAFMHLHAVQRL